MNNKLKIPSISVVGATGMVGRELIRILEERQFKFSKLKLFASPKSAGIKIDCGNEEFVVEALENADQVDTDIAFFAAGSKISRRFVKKISEHGTICIDKSSYLRMDPDIPLVVNEVNSADALGKKIIANPNCIATPLAQVLAPLQKLASLEQVIVCTYQAVSGAGKAGSDELESQVRDLFNMRDVKSKVFGQRIAFNVIPAIPGTARFDELGKSEEEAKIIQETQKILKDPDLKMDVTCVRVPVFNGHSMAVHLAFKSPCEISAALDVLSKAPGLILINDSQKTNYPTALDACGNDMTLVGRVRPNTSVLYGLSLWIVSDNLRTGAALNAVRIAETITME
jgi:aspartate-semialdehyde dehydrogenase